MERKNPRTNRAVMVLPPILVVLAISLLVTAGCTQTAPAPAAAPAPASPTATAGPGYMDVTPAQAKELIDGNPDLIIIDVSPNYPRGHLPGSVSYYIGDGSLDRAIPTLDKNKKYLVYCHVDSVAIQGAKKLVDAGFTNVYRLAGNYKGWVDAGYPVET